MSRSHRFRVAQVEAFVKWAETSAVEGRGHGAADLAHAGTAQAAESGRERCQRSIRGGVEIDHTRDRHGVGLVEFDFRRQVSDSGRAWSDERPFETWNRSIATQHDDGPPTEVRMLAPPDLSTFRTGQATPSNVLRNDSRSPHSSCVLSGVSL